MSKVRRQLVSENLPAATYAEIAYLCWRAGQVHADAWARCGGVKYQGKSRYDIRDLCMAIGYGWHGLPARLGKAMLHDALGDKLYRITGEVMDADINAACNIRERLYDAESTLHMPYHTVKQILTDRTQVAAGTDCQASSCRGCKTAPVNRERIA